MMAENNNKVFQPQLETIEEFLQRFLVQNYETLSKIVKPEENAKKTMLLARALPVEVLTSIQRKLKPTLLTEAKFEEIEKHLKSLYSTKKSIVGAAVAFVTRKQLPQESIENYSKVLNELASQCEYKNCCLDRMLRDIFIAGLQSSKIMAAIIQDCDEKTFEEVVCKAKVLEQLNLDVEEINPSMKHFSQNAVKDNTSKRYVHHAKNKNEVSVSPNYICGRCGNKGKHYAMNCFAKDLECNVCQMKGHIGKACRNKQSSSTNRINSKVTSINNDYESEDDDPARYFVMKRIEKAKKITNNSRSSSIASLDRKFPVLTQSTQECNLLDVSYTDEFPPLSPPSRYSSNRFSPLHFDTETSFVDHHEVVGDRNFQGNNVNAIKPGINNNSRQNNHSFLD